MLSQLITMRGWWRMLALVLATAFSTSFSLVVRHAQGRGSNLYLVGFVNYVVACGFHLARYVGQGGGSAISPVTVALGVAGGVAYATSFATLLPVMRMRGVSISTAIMRLSVLIPILVAVLWWGERPNGAQVVGAGLALAAMPLLGIQATDGSARIQRRQGTLLAVLFVLNGLCSLSIRAYREVGAVEETSAFLATLFGAAGVVTGGLLARERLSRQATISPSVGALRQGAVLGLVNAGANLALVSALRQIPSVVVFPFQGAVGLVLACLLARALWGERISRLEALGMGVSVIAVAFVNLG